MIEIKTGNIVWTHVSSPTKEQILSLNKKYNFHELILEDLLEMNNENKVEHYDEEKVISIMLNFPKYNQSMQKYLLNSAAIIVGENYIITVTRFHSSNIDKLTKKINSNNKESTTFDILYDVIDVMYDKSVKGLGKASREILKLQERIMYSKNLKKSFLEELMTKKVNMVILQHTFRPQREILHDIKRNVKKHYGREKEEAEEFFIYIDDLDAKLDKIINNISVLFETVRSLTDTYDGLMNIQTNKIITTLTIFTAVTGIMAVIVGAYGMNVPLPFSESQYAFWGILLFMLSLFILIAIWFRKKGWL